jgi:hypothetical protein
MVREVGIASHTLVLTVKAIRARFAAAPRAESPSQRPPQLGNYILDSRA